MKLVFDKNHSNNNCLKLVKASNNNNNSNNNNSNINTQNGFKKQQTSINNSNVNGKAPKITYSFKTNTHYNNLKGENNTKNYFNYNNNNNNIDLNNILPEIKNK